MQARNGFGILFVQEGQISGPVLFQGNKGFNQECLPNHICQKMGYQFAIKWFLNLQTFTGSKGTPMQGFTFDDIICLVDNNGTVNATFNIKKVKETTFSSATVLFCGPLKSTCPIVERYNFLKRVCFEESNYIVFQCPYSDRLYVAIPGYHFSTIDTVCDNDPNFYQSCGIKSSLTLSNSAAICNDYVCTGNKITDNAFSLILKDAMSAITVSSAMMCHIINPSADKLSTYSQSCSNLDLPDNFCSAENEEGDIVHLTLRSGLTVVKSSVCNGRCDVRWCEDEAFCGGYLYGMYCISWEQSIYYIKPSKVCNANGDSTYYYQCLNGEDEKNCPEPDSLPRNEKCRTSFSTFTGRQTSSVIPILNITRCSAPFTVELNFDTEVIVLVDPICDNFLDQTNCTDQSRSTVTCYINGYISTISKFFVCHGQQEVPTLCDNGIDQVCVKVSLTCEVHKHKLCDQIEDCLSGADEKMAICLAMTKRTCHRVYKHDRALQIPIAWLRDGVEDCLDAIDEEDVWQTCGIGPTKRFVVSTNKTCEEVFLCKHDQAAFVEFKDICNGIDTCGHETRICTKSHKINPTLNSVLTVQKPGGDGEEKVLMYCLPGLQSLQEIANHCVINEVNLSGVEVFGVRSISTIIRPNTIVNCDHTFGEVYVTLSCAGYCEDSMCPLQKKIQYNSCPQQHKNRIYTVANNSFLSFVTKRGNNSYKNDYFRCDNGVCLNYDQVCNVVDDCGDGSDEILCTNVFLCDSKDQLVPITEKCNGNIDCLDFSDECNSHCGKQILQSTFLKILSWNLAVLAIFLNSISLYRTLTDFNKEMSKAAVNNKMLILLINLGDLLIGVYLIDIAIMDTIVYRSGYCSVHINWLSSDHCNIIGVISTIGYEMSLVSMTTLALTKVGVIRDNARISVPFTRTTLSKISLIAIIIFLICITIAVIPLVPQFEDFFVNGMTYKPSVRLFIGAPGKEIHLSILQEYYGKIKGKNLKWRVINDLVDGMFSSDYGGDALGRKKIDFYGNEGVCLFKFFVKADDPQRIYAWGILSLNMVCFLIISVCYIFINDSTRTSSKLLTQSKTNTGHEVRKRNRKLQRKISLIIATDFLCWLPVTIASCLHSGAVIDATPYYSLISIVFLPINSVLNPVLYNDFSTTLLEKVIEKSNRVFAKKWRNHKVVPGQDYNNGNGRDHPVQMIEMKLVNSKQSSLD